MLGSVWPFFGPLSKNEDPLEPNFKKNSVNIFDHKEDTVRY